MDKQPIVEQFSGFHWVDHVGMGVAALFLLLGFWRGLWWQVVRLIGLAAAVAVARLLGPPWGRVIGELDLPEAAAHGLGWVSAFLLTLIGAAILGMIGSKTIEAMKLSLINRSIGCVAGLATGILLHSSAVWGCVSFVPHWRSQIIGGLDSAAPTLTGWAIKKLADLAELFPLADQLPV